MVISCVYESYTVRSQQKSCVDFVPSTLDPNAVRSIIQLTPNTKFNQWINLNSYAK